jgi:hypothetical protein
MLSSLRRRGKADTRREVPAAFTCTGLKPPGIWRSRRPPVPARERSMMAAGVAPGPQLNIRALHPLRQPHRQQAEIGGIGHDGKPDQSPLLSNRDRSVDRPA